MNSLRIVKLDMVRTFAIVCVVLCHCSELVYSSIQYPYTIGELSIQSRLFMVISFTLGRLGVPFFLFLTGALLLKKTMDSQQSVLDFYKAKLLPLILINTIWIILYNLFLAFFLEEKTDVFITIKEILLLKNSAMINMWYMPMIIGMYVGLPFVAKIVKNFLLKTMLVVMIGIFIISYIIPAVNIFMKIYGINEEFVPVIQLPFLGGAYGLYIILGYYMHNDYNKNVKSGILIIVALISFIITVAVQYFSYEQWSKYNYKVWYDFPFMLITSLCIFLLFEKIKDENIKKGFSSIFTYISKISFSIFLVHIIVAEMLKKYIVNLGLKLPFTVFLFTVSTFIISIIIIFILSRNKYIAKYCLLIK